MGTWFCAEQPSACSLDPRRADGNPLLGSIGLLICRRWRELFLFRDVEVRLKLRRSGRSLASCSVVWVSRGGRDSDGLTAVCCVDRSDCPLVTVVDLASQSVVWTSWMSWGNSGVGGSGSVHACLGMSMYVTVTSTLGAEGVAWSHPWCLVASFISCVPSGCLVYASYVTCR